MVTTTSFTLNLNGSNHGLFHVEKGIRQGVPLSPLVFVLVMEYLTRSLKYAATHKPVKFHPLCRGLKLLNLCFAYDLMIFCKTHTPTVSILMDAFKHFSRVTGLQANANKSHIFLAGAQEQTCTEIVNITGFCIGTLPPSQSNT